MKPSLLALALAVAGCNGVTTATLDHAVLPTNAVGQPIVSPDYAVGLVAYTLGHPSSTDGQPAHAALALAAVDYLAGDFYVDPRFEALPALDKVRMMQGRGEVRRLLGIAPGSTSQQVVDGLIAASGGYNANDQEAVVKALPVSVFTLGPARTTEILSHLPYLVSANAAAQNANASLSFGCGGSGNCF